ncbi:hypothetical protein KSF_004740 [Reticulibacter mediterranei]|uniref:Uncharacterized protein n=1 Tax=Reticulibacter mediterranei TaxID=2778369 RepID=A0A8J3IIS8_9CHLR|nr:hypothetical protein KSF_004740 [Reticulibacter mediterranei]
MKSCGTTSSLPQSGKLAITHDTHHLHVEEDPSVVTICHSLRNHCQFAVCASLFGCVGVRMLPHFSDKYAFDEERNV